MRVKKCNSLQLLLSVRTNFRLRVSRVGINKSVTSTNHQSEMTLNKFETFGFQMFYLVHIYLWPFPAKWDSTFTTITPVNPKLEAVPFVSLIFLMFLYGVVNISIIIYFSYFYDSITFDRANSVMLFLAGGCFLGMSTAVIISKSYTLSIFAFIRDLMRLSTTFTTGKIHNHSNHIDVMFSM